MQTRRYLCALALGLVFPLATGAATVHAASFEIQRPASGFLEAVKPRFLLPEDHLLRPRFCDGLRGRTRCPPILSHGGGHGFPAIDPVLTLDLPNVRVSFFVEEISNEVVANGGVDTAASDAVFIEWETSGSAADVENGGPYGWVLPGPGQTFDSGLMIYDALVLGACGSFASFPVEHSGTVTEGGDEIGVFTGTDNSTLDHTGYYTLDYTIRAEDEDGGVSDFRVEGIVSATCSGLNSL